MGFTELADLDCTVTTALGGVDRKSGKKNPTKIEGYYIGTRQVVSPKSKTGFAALHVFQTKEGNVGVWGKTNLDQKMGQVTPGSMARVSFVGMVETKNNPMYKYKVEIDSSNTIDVASAEDTSVGGIEESAAEESEELEESDLFEEEAPMDEIPVARAAAPKRAATPPTATQQERVKALLNGSRAKAS